MIPGLSSDILGKDGEAASTARLKKCMTIMDSMCDEGERAISVAPSSSAPKSSTATTGRGCLSCRRRV